MNTNSAYYWIILAVVVISALLVDSLVFHRKPHEVSLKEALAESAGWIALALAFDAWIYHSQGREAGLQFLTAYLVEKSLSMDNILVFILTFASLRVPAKSQHKVLFYGVAGALVMRALFVFAGIELLNKFRFMLFFFGAILLVTGIRMLLPGKKEMHPGDTWLVRLTRKIVPVSDRSDGGKFWVTEGGQRKATALLLALVAVEAMDIVFAVDSVPAVLAITRDSFIAYSSNAFAVLGLRALYFALSGALKRLRYLHQGLAAILIFVAAKMVAGDHLPVSTEASLAVVGSILLLTALASLIPQSQSEN